MPHTFSIAEYGKTFTHFFYEETGGAAVTGTGWGKGPTSEIDKDGAGYGAGCKPRLRYR